MSSITFIIAICLLSAHSSNLFQSPLHCAFTRLITAMMRSSMPLRDDSSHTQSQKHISSLLRPDHGTAIHDDPGNREAPQLIDSLPTTEADHPQTTATDLSSGPAVQNTTHPKRYVQKQDWDFHKTTIISLYISEDRSLKDVMHLMASRYDFHATVKMYKSRLTAWHVRKYMAWVDRETACQSIGITRSNNNELGTMVVGGNPRNRQVFLRHTRTPRFAATYARQHTNVSSWA